MSSFRFGSPQSGSKPGSHSDSQSGSQQFRSSAGGGGWGGRSQFSNGTRRDDPAENKVYVTGFPHLMKANQLRLIFIGMRFQEVVVTLNTKGLNPFAFVTFRSQEDATKALSANGCKFIEDGESFELTVSTVREKTQFREEREGRGGEAAYTADPIPTAAGGGAVGGRWGNYRNQSSQSQQQQPAQQLEQQPVHSPFSIAIELLLISCFVDESVARKFAETYVSSHTSPSGEYTEKDVRYAFEFYKRQLFINKLVKELEELAFVTPQRAMDFAREYAMSSERSEKLQGEFQKVEITIAIDAFRAKVSLDLYTFIGCPQRAIAFDLLPPSIQKKVLQAVPPESTGTLMVPNCFLYMMPSDKNLCDIESFAQGYTTAIISCAIVTESGILMSTGVSLKKTPVLIFPDLIGTLRPDRFAVEVVKVDSTSHSRESDAVESGFARSHGDTATTRNKLARELNANSTLMCRELKHWVAAMRPISTQLYVSFPVHEPVAQATTAVPVFSESSESYNICKHGNFLKDGSSPCQECLSNGGKDTIKDGWGETLGYRK